LPRTYDGIAYRQSRLATAPWLVSFVASAEEILEWAGIPRRSEHNLSGFQRGADPVRIEKAKRYFELPVNQSPTALVLGIHPTTEGMDRRVTLDFTGGEDGDAIRSCRLTVLFDGESLDLPAAVEIVRRQLEHRLGDDDHVTELEAEDDLDEDTAPGDEPESEVTENQGEQSLTQSDDEEDAPDDEIELGRSILRQLLERLDDSDWYSEEENAIAIRDLAKPATVIDGQHRVKGAEACERNIPFAVCAIYDCPWPEQVFQFTVVNYTAKGIPDQFITANAALSLTRGELDVLRDRLVQADVKVIEYELMQVVQFDDQSPFNGLVDLSEKRAVDKIGYKTMVQVAKAWYDAKHPVFSLLLPSIYPDIKGRRAKSARVERWKSQDWGDFFLDFWKVVYNEYASHGSHEPGHQLWEPGHSQLVLAVVLLEFQKAYLENLNAQDEEFFELQPSNALVRDMRSKLERRADKFVDWFPPEFFATRWKLTSLNTGPGRVILQQVLRQFVDSKGQYQYARSPLVTGQTER
jgi:hypothetical protein